MHSKVGAALFVWLFARWTACAFASNITCACEEIAAAISSVSDVYWPLELQYTTDIYHYASSSTAQAACSVEPGTAEDLGIILQILGKTRTPFGVKGGGHIMNPGWSSSTGVQIAMYRFNEINYDAASQSVDLGSGLIWDDVYAALEPYNVSVLGGRVSGIGVAGFSLGGGYAWKTNQYGLTVDNILAYELVLPNGTIVDVSESSCPDLYFGLKGGFNNFGVVTKFTMKAWPQTEIWGGVIEIDGYLYAEDFKSATANFSTNVTDPKATVLLAYNYAIGVYLMTAIIFYDAPTPPRGIFDEFLAIPYLSSDVCTRSFLSLVQASPSNITSLERGFFNTVSLQAITPTLLDVVHNESLYWGALMSLDSGTLISYDVEPFLPNILTHGGPSAFPPTRSERYLPLNLYYSWTLPTSDDAMYDVLVKSADTITNAAIAEGQDIPGAALYPNYALYGTAVEKMYGDNAGTLAALKAKYDPENVMGLAGGWKF
ncbi:FAD-binding domain-containing protein [Sparassis latifolia]